MIFGYNLISTVIFKKFRQIRLTLWVSKPHKDFHLSQTKPAIIYYAMQRFVYIVKIKKNTENV